MKSYLLLFVLFFSQISFTKLEFKNFNITERGDLRDIVNFRNTGGDLVQTNQAEIPSFDDL